MKIVLKLKKDVNQNAADYFEKAKKAKRKWKGAEKALVNSKKKLEELKEKLEDEIEKERERITKFDTLAAAKNKSLVCLSANREMEIAQLPE